MDPLISSLREQAMLKKRTTISNNSTPLLRMPNEILVMIAERADRPTLRLMRLVCKKLNNYSTETFGRTQLHTRRFVFSEYGIRGFHDLVFHPVLGHFLRSAQFSTFRLDLSMNAVVKLGRKCVARKIGKSVDKGVIDESFKCTELLKASRIHTYTSDEAAGTYKRRFTPLIEDLLHRAFKRLYHINIKASTLSIGVYDDFAKVDLHNVCYKTFTGAAYETWPTAHQKGYGWNRLYDNLPCQTWQYRPDIPLRYLKRALAGCGWNPSITFSLQALPGEFWAPDRFHKQRNASHYVAQNHLINHLIVRGIDTLWGPLWDRQDVCVKDPLRMIKLHGKTACLEFRGIFVGAGKVSLLEVPIFPDCNAWGGFRGVLLDHRLEELRISCCAMRIIDLISIICHQALDLKKIIISNTTLIFDHDPHYLKPITHWYVMPRLFDLIQDLHQLEAFSFDHVGLADADKDLKMIFGYDVYEEIWKGREMICDRAAACAAALREEFNAIEDFDMERMIRVQRPTTPAFLSSWTEKGEQTEPPTFYDCSGKPVRKGFAEAEGRW
ncbi:hypothetical protein D6C76_09534 [Aureobasidium pullulans]|nr:hypothetical protein D6D26_05601 [Aureobasidium pullulans]TIA64837.1 hypothetical protein D6C76_09534 [Aureobasidium pullulans]